MRVALSSVGCKLNQAELEQVARRFLSTGHQIVHSIEEADLHVVNSCAVTHIAARDSRKVARRAWRRNPRVRTVLTGCWVAADREAAARLAGVDLVVANHEKHRLIERVEQAFPELAAINRDAVSRRPPCASPAAGGNRALVKIEDGCNARCSFCIIPTTRGSQRSRPLPEIVAEVRALADRGCKEVVITGVQISAYHWQKRGLYELTRALLEQTSVPRLRLSSIAPWGFDRRLLVLFESHRLCRHVHLSLQSGCSTTLRRMRRPCDTRSFARLVGTLRDAVPGLAVTTDVIVGFPGETDDEYERSMQFIQEIEFARIHAFPFSPRPGTAAVELDDPVPYPIKRQRMDRMLATARIARRSFEAAHLDTTVDVLWEYRRRAAWHGTTDNYLRVTAHTDEDLCRRITRARITAITDRGLICKLAEPAAR